MVRKIIYGAAIIFCLVGIPQMPEIYYTYLKVAVTVAALFAAYELIKEKNLLWLPFVGVALLFNPLFHPPLTRALWIASDVVVIAAFSWMIIKAKRKLMM